ncbi:hypothetical protein ABIA35_009955, partial [Catenulispora sp. MAP12-49]
MQDGRRRVLHVIGEGRDQPVGLRTSDTALIDHRDPACDHPDQHLLRQVRAHSRRQVSGRRLPPGQPGTVRQNLMHIQPHVAFHPPAQLRLGASGPAPQHIPGKAPVGQQQHPRPQRGNQPLGQRTLPDAVGVEHRIDHRPRPAGHQHQHPHQRGSRRLAIALLPEHLHHSRHIRGGQQRAIPRTHQQPPPLRLRHLRPRPTQPQEQQPQRLSPQRSAPLLQRRLRRHRRTRPPPHPRQLLKHPRHRHLGKQGQRQNQIDTQNSRRAPRARHHTRSHQRLPHPTSRHQSCQHRPVHPEHPDSTVHIYGRLLQQRSSLVNGESWRTSPSTWELRSLTYQTGRSRPACNPARSILKHPAL